MVVECHSCGGEFDAVGGHWRQTDCPYPQLDERQYQILTGSLMGDGSIMNHTGNPRIKVKSITKDFLQWIDDELGILSTGVQFDCSAEDSARTARSNGLDLNAEAEDYSDVYRLITRALPCLQEFVEWYDSGNKLFPETLEITPLIAKVWYCCDGSLRKVSGQRPQAYLVASNEMHRPEYIEGLFEDAGFNPNMTNKNLIFNSDDTERLMSWMGDPIPGFEYKWA